MDAWFYQSAAGDAVVISRGGGAASWSAVNGHEYYIAVLSGALRWDFNTSGSVTSISTTAPAAGAWHHIAVGYNGTTTRVWLNGASVGTSTAAYTLPTTRNLTRVGYAVSNSTYFTGYISSLRIVKGTDVYGVGNTSITVPTAPLTAITNTSLLLNFTNAGVLDATAKNDLETVGNAQISTAQSKWGGSSIAFDGTGDYLTSPDSDAWSFGTGNFTVEGWVYPAASPNQPIIVGQWSGSGGSTTLSWVLLLSNDGNRNLRFATSSDGANVLFDLVSSSPLTLNAWSHVAVVRNGNTFQLYLNGTAATGGSTTSSSSLFNATNALSVGSSSAGTQPFNGYIDDLRITKGVARYTANFTAPTAPFPLY